MISASLEKSDVCMRMCNDEFIVAYQVMGEAEDHADAIVKSVESRTREFNRKNGDNFVMEICYAVDRQMVANAEALDYYVNALISNKNNAKIKAYIESTRNAELAQEDIEKDELATEILDRKLLTYHFQPSWK